MDRVRLLLAGVALVVSVTACGGGADEQPTSAGATDDPPPGAPADGGPDPGSPAPPSEGSAGGAAFDVPDVEVRSVPSGDAVNIRTLAQGNDTLFWFWAPH